MKLYAIWYKHPMWRRWEMMPTVSNYPDIKALKARYVERWPTYAWRIKPEGLEP